MKFADFVCFDAIVSELTAKDRDGAIAELVSQLDKAGRLGKGHRQEIIKATIKREKETEAVMPNAFDTSTDSTAFVASHLLTVETTS